MLPKLNIPSRRLVRDTVAFRGLDRSAQAGEGDFTHQRGLSPDRWPHLSPARQDRVEELTGCDGVFLWNGHRVLAKDGQLWCDGQALCNLTAGDKQFAVVNTSLVVWPDALAVDLEEGSVTCLSVRATNRGRAVFTTHTLTLDPRPLYATTTLRYRSADQRIPWLWVYDKVDWSREGGWVCEGGRWERADSCVGLYAIPTASYSQQTSRWTAQMPAARFDRSRPTDPGQPDNGEGICTLITHLDRFEQGPSDYICDLSGEVYWLDQQGQALDGLFRVGDALSVTGSYLGLLDVDKVLVRSLDRDTNTLTFDPATFPPGEAAAQLTGDVSGPIGLRFSREDKTVRYKVADFTALASQRIVLDTEALEVYVLDGEGQEVGRFAAQSVTSLSGLAVVELTPFRDTQLPLEVVRPIPDLGYICHHDNRLWGVSNADNCVYASALGDPCSFYRYDGLATDSYTVAVGSQGPFTGICAHNGSVLCWKEQGLHKVLGTLPANYQLATYTLSGVGRGSSRSLVSLDGSLYYLGRDGVYRYTGSFPRCISQALGQESYSNASGGTDGKCYYLSAQKGDGSWELLVFHPDTGLWWGREALAVREFVRGEEGLLALTEDQLRTLDGGEGYQDFEAVLAPMTEELEQVQYTALLLRAQLGEDSWLQVDFRRDGGSWQQAGLLRGRGGRVEWLRLPLGRCASLEVRFRGHGDCQVLELSRQYRKRGRG